MSWSTGRWQVLPTEGLFVGFDIGQQTAPFFLKNYASLPECDVPVPGIPGIRIFIFFWWYRIRYRYKLEPEKSLGTGVGKFGTGKESLNRYRNFFDTGTDLRR